MIDEIIEIMLTWWWPWLPLTRTLAWKVGNRRFEPLWRSSFKETKSFFPTRKNSILWEASVTERKRAWPHITRAWISNSVSRGRCHLNNLFTQFRPETPLISFHSLTHSLFLLKLSSLSHFCLPGELFSSTLPICEITQHRPPWHLLPCDATSFHLNY